MKIPRPLYARVGLASMPVTAFAPLVGAALTGHGAPWVILPVGSMVAFVAGTCAERRAAASTRYGVIVPDPDLNDLRTAYGVAPRDEVTVVCTWSDAA